MREGYLIDLSEEILPRLPRKTRNTIRRAGRELYIRAGTLNELRAIHWNPVYLPKRLTSNQNVYVAVLDDELPPISAVMVETVEDRVIYRYSGNDKRYSGYNGNTYLLWWIAEMYRKSGYKMLDLGGSAKPDIEAFKRRISTDSYPLKPKPLLERVAAKLWYHSRRITK